MLLDEYIEKVKNIMLDIGCHIVSEVLEECNTLIEESLKKMIYWQIKDREQKNIMSSVGMLSFTHTRFTNKETKETAYLLDRILELGPHTRMTDEVKANLLEEAVQTSYEKAGQIACHGECVSKETVMRYARKMDIPFKSEESVEENNLYLQSNNNEVCFLHFAPSLLCKKSSTLRRRTTLSTRPFIYHISVSGKLSLYLHSSKHK